MLVFVDRYSNSRILTKINSPLFFFSLTDQCPVGQVASPGSIFCINCPVGSYNTSIANKTCEQCPVGWMSTGGTSCQACLTGEYQSKPGQPFCLPCIPGKFQGKKGTSKCIPCDAGTFSNVSSLAQCYECPEGYSAANAESSSCSKCSVGKFQDKNGQVSFFSLFFSSCFLFFLL